MPKLKNPISTSNQVMHCWNIPDALDLLAEKGYGGMEIWACLLKQDLEAGKTTLEEIRDSLDRNNISGVIHCPLRDLKDSARKLSICSKDKEWREKSLKFNMEAIDFAHQLDLKIITIHPGHTDKEGEEADDEYWELQIDAFKRLTKHAEERGVFIGLEPMEKRSKEFITDPEHAQRILHAVGSENLGITFDLIHAYTHGDDMMVEFLDWMEEQVIHVHVSGHSQKKTHVPFYLTEMDHEYLDNVFRKLAEKGYDGFISIEGHTKGLHEQSCEHQEDIIVKNMEFLHKELKALHLE